MAYTTTQKDVIALIAKTNPELCLNANQLTILDTLVQRILTIQVTAFEYQLFIKGIAFSVINEIN